MKTERWKQIEQLFLAAVNREEGRKTVFLQEACGEDKELRLEVESLLAQRNKAESFIETPVPEVAAQLLAGNKTAARAGQEIGPYEILSVLGRGGMGEVYRARDPRVGRDVAIKIAAEQFDGRSQREARAVAALNHPNICTLYDVGPNYLVMELVEGPTLADRIKRGPFPLREALEIARQIAEALGEAHEKGIVHRDLKPANAKITPDGRVKVLDFGLAQVGVAPGGTVDDSPTWTMNLTQAGMIIGTAPYMAPEQARGIAVDKRADIWAFGVVLYEMLTGEQLFQGNTVSDILAAVLKEEPDFNRVPAETRRLLRQCLNKDPKRRLRDIGDAWPLLEETREEAAVTSPRRWPGGVWMSAVVMGTAIFITGAAVWTLKPVAPAGPSRVAHLSVTLRPGETLAGSAGPPIALSPNGSTIAYASQRAGETRQLYLRAIDRPESMAVSGSDGAFDPFFSPDGEWVGFFSEGKLKKVRVLGGRVETLCEAGSGRGGTWTADDTIYFAPGNLSGLWKVSGNGGVRQELTTLDRKKGEVSHRWPQVLPGGKALLLTVWTGPGWGETQLQLLVLKTGERRTVADGARTGRYASGHLVCSRDGTDTLMAVPFDLDRLQVGAGPPVTLTESVMDSSEGGEFAVSDSGVLAYVEGNPQRYESRLAWVDRNGTVKPLPAPARGYQEPVISPDGSQVAVSITGPAYGVWIYDLRRLTLTPLIAAGSSQAPLWTPNGKRVVYRATRKGFRNIFWRAVDGSGDEEQLTEGGNLQTPGAWSHDGKQWIFQDADRTTGNDIWVKHMGGDGKQQAILKTPNTEFNPHLSADDRWLAYVSDVSGRPEIWVQPFPKLDHEWKVSTEGGIEPVWSRDGRELFYRDGTKMMSVQIAAGPAFSASSPRMLFEGAFQFSGTSVSGYDVSPDGRRFLMVQPRGPLQPAGQFHIVLNWFEELRRR